MPSPVGKFGQTTSAFSSSSGQPPAWCRPHISSLVAELPILETATGSGLKSSASAVIFRAILFLLLVKIAEAVAQSGPMSNLEIRLQVLDEFAELLMTTILLTPRLLASRTIIRELRQCLDHPMEAFNRNERDRNLHSTRDAYMKDREL